MDPCHIEAWPVKVNLGFFVPVGKSAQRIRPTTHHAGGSLAVASRLEFHREHLFVNRLQERRWTMSTMPEMNPRGDPMWSEDEPHGKEQSHADR